MAKKKLRGTKLAPIFIIVIPWQSFCFIKKSLFHTNSGSWGQDKHHIPQDQCSKRTVSCVYHSIPHQLLLGKSSMFLKPQVVNSGALVKFTLRLGREALVYVLNCAFGRQAKVRKL